MQSTTATRTGLAGFLVGGGVLAVLQVLQQVVGAFNPREVVTVGIAVAVALATMAAARWRARAGVKGRLSQALRAWPLPLLKDADPLLLGVWPQRRRGKDAGATFPEYRYRAREVDRRLRGALVEPGSSFVLVYGPPRAGKSRTAKEAAQRALGDTPVIVPRGAEALDALLDPDLQLELGETGVVLWLDGLERYVDTLDDTLLDALTRIHRRAKIVATIRTGEWRALLSASGQLGETAKAIRARARDFEVRRKAERIGRRRPTSGEEHDVSTARVGQRSGWLDRGLVLPAAGSLVALLVLAASVTVAGFSKSIPPPISEQVRAINRDATVGDPATARDDRHPVIGGQKVDLQGTGEPSYVFVFQDARDQDSFFKRLFGGDNPDRPASDELRVYDIEDGRLQPRFQFQPDGTGPDAATFAERAFGDVDADGADELIAGYGLPADASEAKIPFALDWSNTTQSYEMVPLKLEPPALPTSTAEPGLEPLRAAYTERMTLRDADTGRALSGYRTQDFAIDPEPVFRLLAGYLLTLGTEQHDGVMRLQPYQFRTGAPRVAPCDVSDQPLRTVIPNGGTRENALRDKWESVSEKRKCVPR